MKHKIFAFLLSVIMLFSICPAVYAEDDITVLLNGQEIVFPDQKPMIVNSRTLVPFRAIFEALGCSVEWDGINRAVYGTFQDGDYQRVVSLFIGKTVVMNTDRIVNVNDAADIKTSGLILDVAPDIYNNRTLVPLRAVSEILGATVGWNGDTRTVTIDTADPFEAYKIVPDASLQTYIDQNILADREFVITADKGLKPAQMNDLIKEAVQKATNDFASAASFYDEGAGETLHAFIKGSVDHDLEALVESLPNGAVGSVFLSDGYHIVKKVTISEAEAHAKALALHALVE